jgi:hypothetical protein
MTPEANIDTYSGIVIHPDGVMNTVALPPDARGRLRALQELVGGCIEGVALPDGRYMLVNENGKDGPHIINQVATDLVLQEEAIRADDYIAGVAVILPKEVLE